jgi:hypothetical protein
MYIYTYILVAFYSFMIVCTSPRSCFTCQHKRELGFFSMIYVVGYVITVGLRELLGLTNRFTIFHQGLAS